MKWSKQGRGEKRKWQREWSGHYACAEAARKEKKKNLFQGILFGANDVSFLRHCPVNLMTLSIRAKCLNRYTKARKS